MAISLKNINDRVVTLENSLKGGIVQTTQLFKGSTTGQVSLPQSVENFDFIFLVFGSTSNRDIGDTRLIPKNVYGQDLPGCYGHETTASRFSISGTTFKFTLNWAGHAKIEYISGVKIAKTLYYKVLDFIISLGGGYYAFTF